MDLFEFDFFIDGHVVEIYIAAKTMQSAFKLATSMHSEKDLVGVLRKNAQFFISIDDEEDE